MIVAYSRTASALRGWCFWQRTLWLLKPRRFMSSMKSKSPMPQSIRGTLNVRFC